MKMRNVIKLVGQTAIPQGASLRQEDGRLGEYYIWAPLVKEAIAVKQWDMLSRWDHSTAQGS